MARKVTTAAVAEPTRPALSLARDRAGDPLAYVELVEKVADQGLVPGGIKPNAANQMIDVLGEACEILTLRKLEDAALDEVDPLEGVRAKMAKGAELLPKLERGMKIVDAARKESQQRMNTESQHSERWYVLDDSPVALKRDSLTARRASRSARYVHQVIGVVNTMLGGAESFDADKDTYFALNAKRRLDLLNKAALTLTGEELADISRAAIGPYQRFVALDETSEEQLVLLREAYHTDPRVTAPERTLWDDLILRTVMVQRQARSDPAKLMVYVFRDEAQKHKGDILEAQWFHVAWFDTMNDPDHRFSLVMGHPGTGKSSVMRANDAWVLGNHDEFRGPPRLLVLNDNVDKAKKEISVMLRVLKSGWYRAVFPNIRVLDRNDSASQSNRGFTVGSVGHAFAREQTVEGCSIFSNPNGSRYDRIRADDFSAPECRWQDQTRERVHRNWEGVIQPRLDAGGRIVAGCTPWHPDDAPSRIRKAAKDDPNCEWLVRADEFAIRMDENRLPIPLWPARFDQRELIRRMKDDHFGCTHQLSPEKNFRRGLEGVRYYPSDPNDPLIAQMPDADKASLLTDLKRLSRGERWLSIDPASADTKIACDIGCGKWVLTETGKLCMTHMYWKRGQVSDLQRWVLQQIVGETIYNQRRIDPDDSHDEKVRKLGLARTLVRAGGDVDQVAMESGGPQTAQFNLMRDYIADQLRSMGVAWNGTVHSCLPQDGSHTNVSKEIRFNGVANFFRDGTVQFPGRLEIVTSPSSVGKHGGIAVRPLPPGADDDVAKCVRQFLNFPIGGKDGVDQGVQLVIKLHGENRLGRAMTEEEVSQATATSPIDVALRATIRELMNPTPKEPMDEEQKWTLECLSPYAA